MSMMGSNPQQKGPSSCKAGYLPASRSGLMRSCREGQLHAQAEGDIERKERGIINRKGGWGGEKERRKEKYRERKRVKDERDGWTETEKEKVILIWS
ncbi:hypothetical protein PoB_006941600 [Plakobranchus ocellatus]|uniref:Uncharacterized protein n=1 Tax=Plakobranchus ocellatus TaxID=259542 RepID=A0AAV4DFH5_9GAST|nr:hypothetical protein PoB_006941600 [Plakobranchus ocellatus]